MKKIAILLFLFASHYSTFSQTGLDKLMTEKAPNCEDVAYNCTQLIEKYYIANSFDSLKLMINYWEEKCGISEPLIRIKILLSVKENKFSETLYDTTIFDYTRKFKERVDCKQPAETYIYYKLYFSFVQINGSFDKFTSKLANELIISQQENSLEYLFCKLYAGFPNEFYSALQKNVNYNGSKLKLYYDMLTTRYLNLPELNWSMSTGIWIPLGKANVLGNHPLIGFEAGTKYKKYTYNLSINFKFVNSPVEYSIVLNDSVRKTDYFFGGYIGLDAERELLKFKNNEIGLRIGAAFDGFSSLLVNTKDNNPANDKGKSINSLNINGGISYKYSFSNRKYLGVRGKYNFVRYKNKGGTNLSGNTLTFELIYGGLTNYVKQHNLNALNYKY